MDPNKMMAQLGQMQAQMEKAQEELKTAYVEHSAGGGAVAVKVSGGLEVADSTIIPDAAAQPAGAVREVREKVAVFEAHFSLAERPLCPRCTDARPDRTVVWVVDHPRDVVAVDPTHEYRGVYHVLGGALSPIDAVAP